MACMLPLQLKEGWGERQAFKVELSVSTPSAYCCERGARGSRRCLRSHKEQGMVSSMGDYRKSHETEGAMVHSGSYHTCRSMPSDAYHPHPDPLPAGEGMSSATASQPHA